MSNIGQYTLRVGILLNTKLSDDYRVHVEAESVIVTKKHSGEQVSFHTDLLFVGMSEEQAASELYHALMTGHTVGSSANVAR